MWPLASMTLVKCRRGFFLTSPLFRFTLPTLAPFEPQSKEVTAMAQFPTLPHLWFVTGKKESR